MDLRNILKSWRGRPVVATTVVSEDANACAADAANLLQVGIRQREQALYADAARSLSRAIALRHDFGEAHHNLGLVHLDQGEWEEAADRLELATHFAPRLWAAHLDLGKALTLLGRLDAAESAYRRVLDFDPRSAAVRLRLGNLAKARGNLEQAIDCYRAAIDCDAGLADAHCQLAFVLYKLGRYEESRDSHAAALAIKPDFAEAHHNLGLLLLETGYPEEALASFNCALNIRPNMVQTRACVAHALRDLGRLEEAFETYDAVLREQPKFGDALINRCYALLMAENFSAGWREYERRFAATATPLRRFPFSQWQGEPLAGRRVLVFAEQGLGDEIMFASCLPDLRATGAELVLECNDRLAPLFARSFPHAVVHGGRKDDDPDWLEKVALIDFQVAIGSLPRYFRGSRDAFPRHDGYLAADPQRTATWRRRLGAEGSGLKVGIAWRGGSLRTRQYTRSVPLEKWLPVLRQPRARFFSLQYGDAARELAMLHETHGQTMRDFSGELSDPEDLAAFICGLDVVISVDNTVAHLAGALGKNVWILLTSAPEWRYPRRGAGMPWYPSARLFRQPHPRAWAPVLAQVGQALCDLADTQSV